MIRRANLFLVLAAVVVIAVFAPLPVGAEGEVIGGTLVYRADGERIPVEGVTISVSQDGAEVGAAVSGADGSWEVPIPGAGTYQVRLDEGTLPDGVTLTDPTKVELPQVDVLAGQQKTVLFPLGEGQTGGVSTYERIGALLVAGLKLGAIIALGAVGLSLVFGVTGLVNFAHAELVTLGAVIAFFFHASTGGPGLPLVFAAIPAVILVAWFGGLQDSYLWRPLRTRGTSNISLMVVSIGLSFALRSLIQLFFGGEPTAYPDFAGQPSTEILGISMVPKHLVTIAVAIVVLFLVTQFLVRSRAGTAMRAVADDKALAESSGINVNSVIRTTWILAGGLAALGGYSSGSTNRSSTTWASRSCSCYSPLSSSAGLAPPTG